MNGRLIKLLAGAALGSAAMFASPVVTVTLTSTASTPFVATVNGVANTSILCDDNLDLVQTGEVWSAYENSLQSILAGTASGLRFNTVSTTLYEEASWLALELKLTPSAASDIQAALWDIFDPGSASTSNSATWLANAKLASNYNGSLVTSNESTVVFLSPDLANPITNKVVKNGVSYNPQEFIMVGTINTTNPSTPEPATFAMFGTGLIFVAVGTFRRRSKKSN